MHFYINYSCHRQHTRPTLIHIYYKTKATRLSTNHNRSEHYTFNYLTLNK